MQPSLSFEIDSAAESRLLEIARESIEAGAAAERAPRIDVDGCAGLLQPAAVFTTLTRDGALRGCVGSLQAQRPLAQAVADSAFNAAFHDRRFKPLDVGEFGLVRIEISVLSAMQPIDAPTRQALLEQLQPGIDGLLVEDRGCRATFLPKVWENLAAPGAFVDQLLVKAGLGAGYWSQTLSLYRYHTHSFGEK
ncbi:MAG TPA: AmmeMemoRadiSam system protein A [Gammaproteobacteria bacterium]